MCHLLKNVKIPKLGANIPLPFLGVPWLLGSFLTLLTLSLDSRQHLCVVMLLLILAHGHLSDDLWRVIGNAIWVPVLGVASGWLRLRHPLVRGHGVIWNVLRLGSCWVAARLGVMPFCTWLIDGISIDCFNEATGRFGEAGCWFVVVVISSVVCGLLAVTTAAIFLLPIGGVVDYSTPLITPTCAVSPLLAIVLAPTLLVVLLLIAASLSSLLIPLLQWYGVENILDSLKVRCGPPEIGKFLTTRDVPL